MQASPPQHNTKHKVRTLSDDSSKIPLNKSKSTKNHDESAKYISYY